VGPPVKSGLHASEGLFLFLKVIKKSYQHYILNEDFPHYFQEIASKTSINKKRYFFIMEEFFSRPVILFAVLFIFIFYCFIVFK